MVVKSLDSSTYSVCPPNGVLPAAFGNHLLRSRNKTTMALIATLCLASLTGVEARTLPYRDGDLLVKFKPGERTGAPAALQGQRSDRRLCAAGNSGTNNDAIPFYPAACPLPNILSVSAGDQMDRLAWCSKFGSQSVAVAAPGMGRTRDCRSGHPNQILATTLDSSSSPSPGGGSSGGGCFVDTLRQNNLVISSAANLGQAVGRPLTRASIPEPPAVTLPINVTAIPCCRMRCRS